MTDRLPVAYADLPAELYPFDVYLFRAADGPESEPIWSAHIAGPGALHVPGNWGFPVGVKVVLGNGDVEVQYPP